jgi:cytochrome b involved in lipid metabolism
MVWIINNISYDLTEFMDKHPGGRVILERTKDKGDITDLFNTFHARADMVKIREMMEKYKIKT